MYRTPHSIRFSSALLAAFFGLGLVATAGGALRAEQPRTGAEMQLVRLDTVVIKASEPMGFAAACDSSQKTAL